MTPAEFAGLKIVQGNGHTDVYLGNYWVQFPPLDADRIDGLRELLARAGWGGAKVAGPVSIVDLDPGVSEADAKRAIEAVLAAHIPPARAAYLFAVPTEAEQEGLDGPPPIWGAVAFAERLRALVAEAEDAGLELRALIEALEEQATAMWLAVEE